MTGVLIACCALCTTLLVTTEFTGHARARAMTKFLAASSFVALAAVGGALHGGLAGVAVFAGLCLSMVGDLCLLSRNQAWFLGGLVAFLLAHIFYGLGFLVLGVSWPAVLAATPPLTGLAIAVWRWLADRVGSLRRAVQAYILVISSMVALASGAYIASPSAGQLGLLVSAILFFLSDLCVARDRFVAPGPTNRAVGLPLYFSSQVGFALSVVNL